jgi:hypothetical protein
LIRLADRRKGQWLYWLQPEDKPEHPSWSAFKAWLHEKHYSHYLDFRSVAGTDYDAEAWFDDELGQNWRR